MGAVKEPPTPATNGVGAPRQYTLHDFDIIKTIGEYAPVALALRGTGKVRFSLKWIITYVLLSAF